MGMFKEGERERSRVSRLVPGAICVEIMETALVVGCAEVDCVSTTTSLRGHFCQVRVRRQQQGDQRFDTLKVEEDGFFLLIYPRRPGEPKLLGGMWEARSGARYYFNALGIARWQ